MPTTISTANHPKLFWPGIHRLIMAEYEQHPKECDMIFDEFTSEQAYEEDVATAPFGLAPVKPEGSGLTYDTHNQMGVKRYTHTSRALGYIVTREERDDNLYMKKSKFRGRMLKESMIFTEETVCASVFNNGFTDNNWDGVPIFSDSHPSYDVGSQSNILSTPADLSESSLEDLLIQIAYAQDSRGKAMSLRPEKLIVAPDNAMNAVRITHSTLQSGTANNDVNAMRQMGYFTDGPMVWHFLNDPDAWFVKTSVSGERGLKKFMRTPMELDEDKEFNTKNHAYSAFQRYSVSCSDWNAVWGSEGA